MTGVITGNGRARPGAGALLRASAAVLLGGMLALGGAQSASAHAELLSATPEGGAVLEEAPAEAVLTFNEPVQLVDGGIRLFSGDDEPVVLDALVSDTSVVATFPVDVPAGAQALSYRVVSADGHPVSGAIAFTVGEAAGPVAVPVVDTATPQGTASALGILTGLQDLSLLVFAGLVLFDRTVLRDAASVDRRSARLLRLAGTVAIASSLLLIPVSASNVTGAPLAGLVSPSAWAGGVQWSAVVAAGMVVAGVVGGYLLGARPARGAGARLLALLPPLLALAAPVLVGHSRSVEPRALTVVADAGHLLAGSFWSGGVVGLLLFLAAARGTVGAEATDAPLRAAAVVGRFSRMALWSVVLLAASGTIMAVLIVGSVDALVSTGYGLTLLLKLAIVVPLIAIAAYNRLRLLPAVAARPGSRMRWHALMRTLGYEAGLLAVVLLVTGFLTNLSPAHEHGDGAGASTPSSPETVVIDAEAQGLSVEGMLDPARTGDGEITFTLEYEGEPVVPEDVTIQASLPAHDLGPFAVAPDLDQETGGYSARLSLPVAGEWEIRIIARVSTFAEPIVTIPVTIETAP